MRIVSQHEMKEIETITMDEFSFSEEMIIESVGLMSSVSVEKKLKDLNTEVDLVFLIGKGNNGAVGLSLARRLVRPDRGVRAFMLFDEKSCSKEVLSGLKMAKKYGVKINFINEVESLTSYFHQNSMPKMVVDAIFGTGVILPLSNFIYDVIHFINQNSNYTIALDMPTGVEGDSGLIKGNAIKADLTLAVGLPKQGYYMADGAKLVGEIEVLEVGFPHKILEQSGDKFLLTADLLKYSSETRSQFADKKIFGHTLVIGGSHGLTGALVMASAAAIKTGAGLVTAATWEGQYQEFLARAIPEVMTGYIPNDQAKWPKLLRDLEKYNSIVIGPGLARSVRARKLVLEILNNFSGPVVVDADAINVLSLKEDAHVFKIRSAPTVFTPHFGEFARFSGLSLEEVHAAPLVHLKSVIEEMNSTIVLKGACTYVGLASGQVYFNFYPNAGMATGGVGDVLAGLLGGLLAQQIELRKSAESLLNRYSYVDQCVTLAVYLHSIAGKFAAKKFGVRPMTAMSLIETLPSAFEHLDNQGNI